MLHNQENRHLVEEVLPRFLGGVLMVVSLVIVARIFRVLGPKEQVEIRWPLPWQLAVIGAVGGFLVGVTSIGGGTVIMALLLIFFNIPLNQLVALDVMHGAMLASVPALTYAVAGQTDWSIVGLLLVGSLPGAWLGARSVKRIDRRLVRGVLSGLVFGAGLHLMLG